MKAVIHPASSRGGADHGWLKTRHSFSFAQWHDPERMRFGSLRVLNDDYIAPDSGFGLHGHENMEIITIVLAGTVTHEDSMGNRGEVEAGEIQAMSAGTGVRHAERNESKEEPLALFQIWIEPGEDGLEPGYAQAAFDPLERKNRLRCVVSDGSVPDTLTIRQKARIYLGDFGAGYEYDLPVEPGNGIYLMVISGEMEIEGERLGRRDAIAIEEAAAIHMRAAADASVLAISVPMK